MAATTRKGLLGKAGVPCCVRVGSGSGTEPRKELDPNGTAKEERSLWLITAGGVSQAGGGALALVRFGW